MSDRLYVTDGGIIIDLEMVRWISATIETGYVDKSFMFSVYVADCINPICMQYPSNYDFGKDFSDLEDFVDWQKNDLYDAWKEYLNDKG
jgi:hypothetical protein